MKTVKFIVSGKVQGVWFRQSTKQQADRLGVKGYAINLDDGNVEVVATGGEEALHKLQSFIQTGPELAKVKQLTVTPLEPLDFNGFTTG